MKTLGNTSISKIFNLIKTKLANYFPLTGGTIYGDLFIQGANNKLFGFKRTAVNGTVGDNIDIGWDWSTTAGSGAAFRSSDASGQFIFFARSADGTAQLIGKPDGTLTWNSNTVAINGNATSYASYNKNYNTLNMSNQKQSAYGYGYNMTNAGWTGISNFIILQYSNDWGTQIQFPVGSSGAPYIRYWQNSGGVMQAWKQLAWNTTTSDERFKDNISLIPDNVLDAWGEVNWYQFQFKDSIFEKGKDKARIHTGTIAQRIKSVFESHNLDAFRYGLLCYDEWNIKSKEYTESIFSIQYEEALCMEAAYQRRRADRLEARIQALENLLNNGEH